MLNSPVEEIKNRLDVVDVIGGYLKLQKAGANYRALCPFHSEKGPSFFVSPAKQMWYCFGCSLGGDIYKFVMQLEGIEFGDALRLLAQRAGVELTAQSQSYKKLQTQRNRLHEILELAARFFERQLSSSQVGQDAKQYLRDRSVAEQSMTEWRIGYAPDASAALVSFLMQKGFRQDEIGKAGLTLYSGGSVHDRFRGRIMFPVADVHGQIIGFGGRIFGKKEGGELAKYINTAATPVYDKGRVLYGLDKAKVAIRKKDACILVEGYMDVIMVRQAGCENVVATSGTALTEDHLRLLKRYTNNLILAFDMDVAGNNATKRGIELAFSQGFAMSIVTMPEGKDPADVVQEGSERWEELISKSISIFDFYFLTTLSRFDKNTPEGKKHIADMILPTIKKIPNKIEQGHWVQRLARELEAKEEHVYEELARVQDEEHYGVRRVSQEIQHGQSSSGKTRQELLEEQAVSFILRDEVHFKQISEDDMQIFSVQTQDILVGLRTRGVKEESAWKEIFSDEVIDMLRCLAVKGDIEEEERSIQELEAEFDICMNALRALSIKKKLDTIAKELKRAETERDSKKVELLLEEFHAVSQKLTY